MLKYLNPLAWARWVAEFVYCWALSAPWRDAPKAIPIILLLSTLLVAAVISRTDASGWRTRLLDSQLADAWKKEDFATVELVLRRQLATRTDDADLVYRLAIARDAQDSHDEALELMRRIVKMKSHEDAARWVLRSEYIGKKWSELEESGREEFGELLKLIHKEKPDDLQIKQLYADYLIAAEKLPQALPLLNELALIQPMRGLQAAAISRRLGRSEAADQYAVRTLEKVNEMLDEDPTNSTLALAVAQNQLFLKRYPEAVRTLDKSVRRAKTNEDKIRLNQAIGDAIVAWVSFIEESPNNSKQERLRILKMLETALKYAPNNPRVLTLLADQVLGTINEQDAQIKSLRQALIDGSSPGISHFIQGTAALMKDEVDTATRHLKMAAELMPRSGAILNNLAVAITTNDNGNLDQALKISNTAIKQTPAATPHFFETRGQILYRLERFQDAIPDLERALEVPALKPAAHKALAECYAKIGEAELARLHAEAAVNTQGKAEPEGDQS